jgi:hypothetical protein
MFELFKGAVPEGKEIHHSCGNPLCVNPEHLIAVTRKEHVELSPKVVSYINGHKTHCAKGHDYVIDQGFLRRTGKRRRYCPVCRMEWQKRHRRQHQTA